MSLTYYLHLFCPICIASRKHCNTFQKIFFTIKQMQKQIKKLYNCIQEKLKLYFIHLFNAEAFLPCSECLIQRHNIQLCTTFFPFTVQIQVIATDITQYEWSLAYIPEFPIIVYTQLSRHLCP